MSEEGGGKTKCVEEEGGGKTKCVAEVADGNSSHPPLPTDYEGTFQGVANYQQPQSHQVMDFPPPPMPTEHAVSMPHYYPQGYQNVTGFAVYEEQTYREERLPCCGAGIGWFLFIIGFFLGTMPWYVGSVLLLCVRLDHRERPGLIACVIAAVLAAPAVTIAVSKVFNSW